MTQLFKEGWRFWQGFFFHEEPLLRVRAYRVVFGFILLAMYTSRLIHFDWYYGSEAWVTAENYLEVFPESMRGPWIWPIWSYAWGLHCVFLLGLLLFALGVLPPLGTLGLWFLHMGFLHRNFGVMYGADQMISLFFLYCVFFQWDPVWRWKNSPDQMSNLWTGAGVRWIQVHIAIIYAYTGFEKLKGSTWWDGTALWKVLSNPQMATMSFDFILDWPIFIPLLTFLTLLFEVYFPVLVILKKTRPWLLGFGVLFHGGITLAIGIPFFSGVMLSSYLLFLDPQWLRRLLFRPQPPT